MFLRNSCTKSLHRMKGFSRVIILFASVAIYLYPISKTANLIEDPKPVLDEIYLASSRSMKSDSVNRDVVSSKIFDLFHNDYWGRPMNSPSSHKSYRPITILSFRLFNLIADRIHLNQLWFQRLISILIHAIIVQMVGTTHSLIFKKDSAGAILSQMWFLLHPVHIESVVNIANRAHLLSLMFGMLASYSNIPAFFSALFYALALLSCETAIFLLPALCMTWVCVDIDDDTKSWRNVRGLIRNRLSRIVLVSIVAFTYLGVRHMKDWLSIPDGLIRPAENPFYTFTGLTRALSYSYILSIHVIKGLGMGLVDLVGFSHEYGFDCVSKVDDISDLRLVYPLLIGVSTMISIVLAFQHGVKSTVQIFTFGAWMATLFPLCGAIKIGTFISDRLVISSSVAASLFWGKICSVCLQRSKKMYYVLQVTFLALVYLYLLIKIQNRSYEWMDGKTLLESSLKSCPRSAKSNLEMSKIYSGLYPEMFDLKKAFLHLKTAEEIDPTYCDVNFQLAQVYLQGGNHVKAEERITNGVLCPFTMLQSVSLFQNYWKIVASKDLSAQVRYQNQLKIIEAAIQQEMAKTPNALFENNHSQGEL